MSAGGSGSPGSGGQDFDLNLAPIIDCFTVLITFMLVSASFLSIGILDAGVAAPSSAAVSDNGKPPEILVQLEIRKGSAVQLQVTGKTSRKQVIEPRDGQADWAAVNREIASLREKHPTTDSVVLSAEDEIDYKSVVRGMEEIRKSIPLVLLGGF